MFSRTWLTVLAGSVALWAMNQLGAGFLPRDAGADGALAVPAPPSPAAAAAAVEGLVSCLDEVALSDATDGWPVERWYRERCRPALGGDAFDVFVVVYGERSRLVVAGILDREARLAAELAAAPHAGALDPDLVWAAALGRAAFDVREFAAELAAWFDARVALAGDGAVVVPAGAAGR